MKDRHQHLPCFRRRLGLQGRLQCSKSELRQMRSSAFTDPVLKAYSRLAAKYDQRWSTYIDASVRETIRRIVVPADAVVLDVGCGTGALLKALSQAQPGLKLHGADPTPAMLAVAAKRLDDKASLHQAYAEALPFSDAFFDLVVSTSAFHFFRDPLKALAEMHRVLRPGGRIIVTDWCHDFFACRVCERVLRLTDRAHHRTYGSSECAALLTTAGFVDVNLERYKISWLWGLMTVSGRPK